MRDKTMCGGKPLRGCQVRVWVLGVEVGVGHRRQGKGARRR